MRKFAFLAFAFGAAVSAQAAVNLNIDNAYKTVSLPSTGSVFLTFTGTVDVLLPTFDVNGFSLEYPGLTGSGPYLVATADPAFFAYMASINPGVDYTGNLFSVEVKSTDLAGNYWFNSSNGLSPLTEFIVTASDGANSASDNEFYGVTINPVPEPATLAALGFGAVGLLRRRRK